MSKQIAPPAGLVASLLILVAATHAAEPFRKVLTTSDHAAPSQELWRVTSDAVTPASATPWSVRHLLLRGGKQEGVELIVVDNHLMSFAVVPTRGMGVQWVSMKDVRLAWGSPVKDVVHPQWVNLHNRGGLGWLEGFNEWMCRCGLEYSGHPGKDEFVNNVGEKATMDLTLHGRIANLPAQEVEVIVQREAPYRITVRGRVDERSFYGPKLVLRTEISTEPGSNALRVADTITNEGPAEQEFQILYHVNYGRTLLEEGSTFVAPLERVTPFNDHAAKSVKDYATYAGPTPGFVEQVYCHRPRAGADGRTLIMLQNKAKDRAVSMAYSLKELPCLTQWKNTAAELDGYVTGLEPGTSFPRNRRLERKAGRVPKLAPGAVHSATIDYTIHVGADQVKAVADKIAAIQGGNGVAIDDQPEKLNRSARISNI